VLDKEIPVARHRHPGSFRYRDARALGRVWPAPARHRAATGDAVLAAAEFVLALDGSGNGSSAAISPSLGKLRRPGAARSRSPVSLLDVRSHSANVASCRRQ
jgi:hypothetical protein